MSPLQSMAPISLYSSVQKNIERFERDFDQIPAERKKILKQLSAFIEDIVKSRRNVELIFICTHNSRRSHISQIWAQTAAAFYKIPGVYSYSGGTEATAFNPRAVKAMQEAGFSITEATKGNNPVYEVRFSDDGSPATAFSKKYDAEGNPKDGFGAVMTCSHADQNCPLVIGAEFRISTPYDDPKDFDGTPQESEKYAERVQEIGREICYAFSLVKS
jgi:arsenate reductase (thioredoxin)